MLKSVSNCSCIAELQDISNEEALTVTDLKKKKAGIQNPKLEHKEPFQHINIRMTRF